MQCPVCDAKLRSVEKHGVEADICPDCKGIWLDRGELEKIMQGVSDDVPVQRGSDRRDDVPRAREDEYRGEHRDDRHDEAHGHGKGSGSQGQKRKGSWLSDIMESFGGGD